MHARNVSMSYLKGVFWGDGYISKPYSIGFNVCDADFAENIIKHIKKLKLPICVYERDLSKKGWRNQTYVQINSRKLVKKLIHEWQLKTPSFKYEKINFINGIFDSDGGVFYKNGEPRKYIAFYSSNPQIVIHVRKILKEFKINNYIWSRIRDKRKREFVIMIAAKVDLTRFHSIFKFSIKRKQDKLDALVKSYAS